MLIWRRRMATRWALIIRRSGMFISSLKARMNICRVPVNGRNFEYFGEDPFLASQIAANWVKAVQSEGVIATIKHFAANNQEMASGRCG